MKIAKNVEMFEFKEENGAMYPVLLWDENDVVLIDTGLPGQLERLREAVSQAGFALEQITKVFITHQDMDHIGSARALSELGAEILAHEAEAPYIQGDVKSVRLAQMEADYDKMNEGQLQFYEQVKKNAPLFFTKINRPLKDGEILDICGGIKVIHTPGHMPGHMALLLIKSGILVTGDAANIIDGKLTGANPAFTSNMPQADESFKKMMAENPAKVATYHGGLYDNAAR